MAKLGRASSHVRIQTATSKHFYVGRKIDGHSIDLLDSPGVGDQDVTLEEAQIIRVHCC